MGRNGGPERELVFFPIPALGYAAAPYAVAQGVELAWELWEREREQRGMRVEHSM